MAGTTLERELTGTRASHVSFDIAGQAHDADIRRLLRETPMAGQISISLEREPNYFADAGIAGEVKQTIIAYDQRRLVCLGSCAIRQRFVNGKSRRVGYLGGLRLDNRYAGRFDILRRGYEFFRALQTDAPADFYFTSIAADNERARRFLERGVAGMPLYEFAGEFVTVIISTNHDSGSGAFRQKCALDVETPAPDQLIAFLNGFNEKHQFAPCWSAEELCSLERLGLQAVDFHMTRRDGRMIACGALWDQGSFKQTVIRGYSPWLNIARPIANTLRHIINGPRLPVIGETLANAFASPLAFASEAPAVFLDLIKDLSRSAREREIEFLTLGFAANDPHLAMIRNACSCREYRSRLYIVRWPGIGGSAAELDGRAAAPELALL